VTTTIAVAGKGGTGKTTFSAIVLRQLLAAGARPILAVDADANTNLNEVLGVPIDKTVASLRDELLRTMGSLPPTMTKETWVEYQLAMAVVEETDYDLVAMGKAELSGCYCYVNDLLKRYLELLQGNYEFVLMDNEAGMEHISRGLVNNVDVLFVLSDPSPRGILTAARIADLVEELKRKVKRVALIVSRVPRAELEPRLAAQIEALPVEFAGVLPADDEVVDFDIAGRSALELPDSNPVVAAVADILERYGVLDGTKTAKTASG
jgi:CO dehydrogenase maturation factor